MIKNLPFPSSSIFLYHNQQCKCEFYICQPFPFGTTYAQEPQMNYRQSKTFAQIGNESSNSSPGNNLLNNVNTYIFKEISPIIFYFLTRVRLLGYCRVIYNNFLCGQERENCKTKVFVLEMNALYFI